MLAGWLAGVKHVPAILYVETGEAMAGSAYGVRGVGGAVVVVVLS